MNCEVQRLENNMRYRILTINGEQYILDMERSFWKIIFPFFVWMFPSTVFRVEDSSIVKRLKEPNKEKVGGSWVASLAGIGYFIGILLAPLMGYFEIPLSPLVNAILIVLALILVAIFYLAMSHRRKKKLENVIHLEKLSRRELWIRPNSKKQVFKLLAAYIWIVVLIGFSFLGYIETGNIIVLLAASSFTFVYLLSSRVTVQEGQTTVKFKDIKHAV
ncbi:DUF443 family protein [Virgibacillus sp. C22-A2]|uniref:DUF443 family protein n=1 Tax=Virgibacillus tibetensis TaxID=3042313 RepID=A0ABU6KIP0_9BACI|nr:DUF443 family protein [Virgibacillus sp. C22-A2]